MLSEITERRQTGAWALVIPATVDAASLGATLSDLLPEVFLAAVACGATPSGPVFARYLAWNPDGTVDLEAGVPVLRPVEPGDRLQCIELDDYRVAAITHTGPYEELGEAHAALGAWVRQHQRETAGPCLECFLTGPGEAIDPAGWRTEVLWPIR